MIVRVVRERIDTSSDGIIAAATKDTVCALDVSNGIIPITTHNGIIVDTAFDDVVTNATVDPVCIVTTVDGVVTGTAKDCVFVVVWIGVLIEGTVDQWNVGIRDTLGTWVVAVDYIITVTTIKEVSTVATSDVIVTAAAGDGIVTALAINCIVATVGLYTIIAPTGAYLFAPFGAGHCIVTATQTRRFDFFERGRIGTIRQGAFLRGREVQRQIVIDGGAV